LATYPRAAPQHRSGGHAASGQLTAAATPRVIAELALGRSRAAVLVALPAPRWVVSLDVELGRAERLELGFAYRAGPLTLAGGARGRLLVTVGHRTVTLTSPPGWLGHGWYHVEATNARLAIDGRPLPVGSSGARTLAVRATAGRPAVAALIVSAASDAGGLFLHRLAELHARIPAGQYPVGADLADRIFYSSTFWTSGFWPGALWQAAALGGLGRQLFAGWALAATLAHFGQERADTHDVGFEYGQSSLAAWSSDCRMRGSPAALCRRLEHSVLSAADELMALAASNPVARTIPTNATGPVADTIVDSMMNIAILPWATSITGNPAYARLAEHQARVIAGLLVRADGSTAQSVQFDRASGAVRAIGTHQGLSNVSTWSRGQGWAVYGFAQAAVALHDPGLLRVAVRLAEYVSRHLPAGGIPLWDYDAPAGAAVDVSAGVITAAGLLHLARACAALSGVCVAPGRWVALARRMLAAALTRAFTQPPLGLLGGQVLNERGGACWCNGGELIFGLSYGLEALALLAPGDTAAMTGVA
jgi:unsaturated chondroitin disaccharide hydrolase